MKIIILGTRGIPARYGGFETLAEELSKRLVQAGHQVTVAGRKSFFSKTKDDEYQFKEGTVRRVFAPTIFHKYLETPLHALTSFLKLFLLEKFDVALLCNAANSPFSFLIRLRGIPLITNVDGIERNRSKWNSFGKIWYKLGERTAVMFSSKVLTDADVIKNYYKEKYNVNTAIIRYGCDPKPIQPGLILTKFNLKPKNYILYVSRFEPENNALGVITAYNKINSEMPLVMVGDAPYAQKYKEELHAAASNNANIIFTGFQFEESYRELRSNTAIYIQATEVGGTHPALVEAMSYGNCIIANDVPEHREVLLEAGLYYNKNDFSDLALKLEKLLHNPELRSKLEMNTTTVAKNLSWDNISNQYIDLFKQVAL